MREIKFRVFDPNSNEMIASNVGIDKIYLYDFDGDNITEQEGLIIMQYTDLKDSTIVDEYPEGIEIYESDVLYEPVMDEKYIVTWDENYGMFFMKNVSDGGNDYDFAEYDVEVCNSLYVIGNTYENPELLEKTK